MKTLLTTTAAALLIAGTAYAADELGDPIEGDMDETTIQQPATDMGGVDAAGTFSEFDTDQDQYLTRDEYEAGVSAHPNADQFPSWDELSANSTDPEGRLSQDEYEDAINKSDPADAATTGTSDSLGGME